MPCLMIKVLTITLANGIVSFEQLSSGIYRWTFFSSLETQAGDIHVFLWVQYIYRAVGDFPFHLLIFQVRMYASALHQTAHLLSEFTTKPTKRPLDQQRLRSACIPTKMARVLIYPSLDSPEAVECTCESED